MTSEFFTLNLSLGELGLVIEALEYVAHNEAGMSQVPDLFSKEDTAEWHLAERIKKELE